MKKTLNQHTIFIEDILKNKNDNFDWKALGNFHRVQIGFFQHERLIHLLVTLFFGLIFLGSVMMQLILNSLGFLITSAILLVMLGFYIGHYFILENGVQKLYQLDREISKRLNKKFQ